MTKQATTPRRPLAHGERLLMKSRRLPRLFVVRRKRGTRAPAFSARSAWNGSARAPADGAGRAIHAGEAGDDRAVQVLAEGGVHAANARDRVAEASRDGFAGALGIAGEDALAHAEAGGGRELRQERLALHRELFLPRQVHVRLRFAELHV